VTIKSTSKRWEGGDTEDKIRFKPSELLNKETSEPRRAINNTKVKGNKREEGNTQTHKHTQTHTDTHRHTQIHRHT